jgi:alkylation response protein AidB-like acyl-CoA dehydrogenase
MKSTAQPLSGHAAHAVSKLEPVGPLTESAPIDKVGVRPTTSADALDALQEVQRLEPLLRAQSASAEREHRLPDVVGRALRDAGLYTLAAPKALGGRELDPMSAFRVIEELARFDSAVGWNVQLSTGCEPFGAWLPQEGAEEIFTSSLVLGGTLNPPAQLVPVDGGYRITGRSPFVSGCHQCEWFFAPATITEGGATRTVDGESALMIAFFPAAEAEILDNWDTLGMCGTGSHDVAITNVFIPARWTAPLVPLETPNVHFEGPLFRLKFWSSVAVGAAPPLGIARAAIDDFIVLSKQKTPAYTSIPLRERATVQSHVARAEADLSAARAYMYEVLQDAWWTALLGRWITTQQKVRIQLAACHATQAAARAVDLVFAVAGTTGIRNQAPYQKYFRDVHTITQHAFLSASRFESAGQMMLDVDTDWPFFRL